MKKVYISLYNKQGLEQIANTLHKAGWEIYAALSTYKYLTEKGIPVIEIKTNIHPNLAVISSFSSLKNIFQIPNFNLIISDISEELEDEIYNFILIIGAVRKKIPVIFKDYERFIEQIKIFGDLTKNTLEGLENEVLNLISYIIAKSAFSRYPYLNEKLEFSVIPLKKIKELKYGENPHQKGILYLTPLKGFEFEIIKGELNTNHFFDIKKALDLMNEIEIPFLMTLNHSNISHFIWGKALTSATKINIDHTVVFNGKLNEKLTEHLINLGTKLIISRDFDDNSMNMIKKTSKNEIYAVKIPHYIKPPKELDFFYFDKYLIVEDRNIHPVLYKTISKRKIETTIYEKIKIGSSIIKHSKTFSCVILAEEEIIGYSQGCSSSYDSLKKSLANISGKKNIKLSEKFEKMSIVCDGPLSKEMVYLSINYPIDIIAVPSYENDKEILKILDEKNIILIVSEKRYYRHV
ncbi:MAG: hypothetical protein N2Z20_05065 [Elusimicrobiales bacterium]|nr:hypothetical protein [Elusimicrobiales bacterium]